MKRILLFLIIIFSVSVLYSQKIYTVLSRGSVKDNSTGLIWTRCSFSTNDKPIYDFNCNGERKKYSWDAAIEVCQNLVHDGRSDWRLPNIKELQSIVFYNHYSAVYNVSQVVEEAFPMVVSASDLQNIATNPVHYWSSTVHKNSTSFAWFIDFYNGNTSFAWRTTASEKFAFVRCVAGP